MVELGTAANFAVLAGSGITNTGATFITGDVGSEPTASMTGFITVTLEGTNHGGDLVTQTAKSDLNLAYIDAAARTATVNYAPVFDLGGLTLGSGIYNNPTSFGLTGTLTLDAAGDPNAVWIFQAGSTFITAANSKVILIGGAQAANVFWQVGSSTTFGANTEFTGSMMTFMSISVGAGTAVAGRLMAQNGAVTLDSNTIGIAVPEPGRTLLLELASIALLCLRRRSLF
ncbi:MAG: hypothetical protein RL693_2791 [Verrucomicrobiota bacterium]